MFLIGFLGGGGVSFNSNLGAYSQNFLRISFSQLFLEQTFLRKLGFMKPGSVISTGEKPRRCLDRVFNFKLVSFTENTVNPLNVNGDF
jgi:hypothetical protein